MKKSIKFLSAALLLGALVACGNTAEPTESSAEASAPTSSKVQSSKHEHTYAEAWEKDETNHWHAATCEHTTQTKGKAAHSFTETVTKPATCKEDGAGKKVCSVCGYETTYTIPKGEHNWGPESAPVEEADCSALSEATCPDCGAKRYSWGAKTFNKISGAEKDASAEFLKLKANGDLVQYQIHAPKKGAATFYFYGFIDYWKDGNNNNDQRGFFSGKNGDTENGNFELTVGEDVVDISAKKGITYEQMGIKGETAADSAWVEVGACEIKEDYTQIQFKRVDSYNMHILKMAVIYK